MNSMKMMSDEAVNEGFSKPMNKMSSEMESEKEDTGEVEKYPYCLRLYLGHEEIKNLGLKELPPIGSVVEISALASVVGLRLDDEKNKTMELQITDMAVASKKEKKSMEQALYATNGEQQAE